MLAKDDGRTLQHYVVRSCLPKIRRRLKDQTLSKPFSESLASIPTLELPALCKAMSTESGSENDAQFLSYLGKLGSNIEIPIPIILGQAKAANSNKPYKVYTEDTCIEFHNLLCYLLRNFEASLEDLQNDLTSKKNPPTGKLEAPGSSHGPPTDGKFAMYSHDVVIWGTALRLLSRSDAITNHLRNIESLLADHRRDNSADIKLETMMGDEGQEGARGEEEDVNLNRVQPCVIRDDVPLSVWKSYLDWLRLMVVHLDAVAILTAYVSSPEFQYDDISIKILLPPRVRNRIFTWSHFLNSKHFPATVETPKIIDFLSLSSKQTSDYIVRVDEVIRDVKGIIRSNDGNPALSLPNVVKKVQSLEGCEYPGWNKLVQEITKLLTEGCGSNKLQALMKDILPFLLILKENSKLFAKLKQSPLQDGRSCTSAYHCEIVLASLIHLGCTAVNDATHSEFQEVLNELQVLSFLPCLL
jgi:hypothetical protein